MWAGNPVLEDDGIGYMYDLEYILTKTGVAEAVRDGIRVDPERGHGYLVRRRRHRIVGWGINPEGGGEAWLVTGFPYDELEFTHE